MNHTPSSFFSPQSKTTLNFRLSIHFLCIYSYSVSFVTAFFKLQNVTGQLIISLRCWLWPFGLQNQVIVTKSVECLNCRCSVFLVVEVDVSEALAESSVLVLCQIHLRFLTKFVREVLEIGVRSRFGKIGNADGRGVIATLSTGIFLLILDERWNVLARLRWRGLNSCRGDWLCVKNLFDVRSSMTVRTVRREMSAVAETTFGELIWKELKNLVKVRIWMLKINPLFGSKTASLDFSSSLLVISCIMISSDTKVVCGFGPSESFAESPNFGSFLRQATLFDTLCLVTL